MFRLILATLALSLFGAHPPTSKTLKVLIDREVDALPAGTLSYSVATYKLQERALMQDSARWWFRGEYEVAKPRKMKPGDSAKLALKVDEARNLHHRILIYFEAENGAAVAPESEHGVLLGWSDSFQLGEYEGWEKKSGYFQMPKPLKVTAPIEVTLAAKAGGDALEGSGYRHCFEAAGFEGGAPVVRIAEQASALQSSFMLSPMQARARWALRVERTGGALRPQDFQTGLLPRSGKLNLKADFSSMPDARLRILQANGTPAQGAKVRVAALEDSVETSGGDAAATASTPAPTKHEPGWNFAASFEDDAAGGAAQLADATGLVQLGVLSWPNVRLDVEGTGGENASLLVTSSELSTGFELTLGGPATPLIPADHPAWARIADWRSRKQLIDLVWVQTNGALGGRALLRQGGTAAELAARQPLAGALSPGEPGAWIVCALVDEGRQLAWYLDVFALYGPGSMYQHQVPGPPPLAQTSIRLHSLTRQGFPYGRWIDTNGQLAQTELAWPPDADGLFRPLVLYGVPKSGCVLSYPTTGPNSIVWNQLELKESD